MRHKNIEIHARDRHGVTTILNRLSAENTEAYAGKNRERLMEKAQRMVTNWEAVYPDSTIFIVEVYR